ncbi:hypothetical protein [Calidifontibacillus erzurumensis]
MENQERKVSMEEINTGKRSTIFLKESFYNKIVKMKYKSKST